MYAILNTKTKKFVYGTDKSNGWPFYQRESSEQMITYSDPEIAKIDFLPEEDAVMSIKSLKSA